jgi:hypothetical protein
MGPLQPFAFATYSKPGALAKTITFLLSAAQAERSFAIPVGKGSGIRAGQVFQFTAGGILSTGDFQGTLKIEPFYGATTAALSLGPSAEQAYVPGLVNVPWRLKGELVFRSVSLSSSSSSIWCTGEFLSSADPSIEGSGMTIPFGSNRAITIDSLGPVGNTSGALNFAATFAAPQVTASISAQYCFVRTR